ncbi:MAG: extracellular solute-binding protein [Defluviitaleaceae bacterium]|nr:extracellular solute-binding protein [Defluviitaleaceae bacterium]MCL2274667.1 extracellular solute-binding protein [Defluviitaleaceae bacterium]MCL2275772.1 extracellular solute-binding protein [Defluviitaleaceae bacterium]
MKNTAYLLLAFIVILLGLSACGGNGNDGSVPTRYQPTPAPPRLQGALAHPVPTPTPTPEPTGTPILGFFPDDREYVEIELWHILSGTRRMYLMELIYAFHDAQPYVRIYDMYHGNHDYLRHNTQVADAAGILPHISQASIVDMTRYRNARMLLSLAPFMDDPNVGLSNQCINDILPVFHNNLTVGGQWFAAPFFMGVRTLFYNAEALRDNNISPPETWEEVEGIAAARLGIGVTDALDWEWASLLRLYGGAYITEAANRADFASYEGIDALILLADLMNGGNVRLATPECFARGEVALLFACSGDVVEIKEAVGDNFPLSAVPVPSFEDQRAAELTGDVLVLFENVRHSTNERVGAWEFLRFTFDTENAANWAVNTGFLPQRASIFYTETPIQYAIYASLPHAFVRTLHPQAHSVRALLLEEFAQIPYTEESPEVILTRAELRANDLLAGR